MKQEFFPARLDVRAFAEAGALLSDSVPLARFARLAAEAAAEAPGVPEAQLRWQAHGEQRRPGALGEPQSWLHLEAQLVLPLTCQRCLSPVGVELAVDRWFRFAEDEARAAAEDEEAEEDVLAASRDFDLLALLEDELLMEIPVTPRHEECPQPLRLSAVDPGFEAAQEERAKPFAVLEKMRVPKP